MPEPTLYLFDGFNLLHAAGSRDVRQLVDGLAGFVALKGARGVVVFDGAGEDHVVGPLSVRYVLAAEHRRGERVCLVSSDLAVRGTSGQEVAKIASNTFLAEFERPTHVEGGASRVRDRLDAETRAKLERLRRGE